MHYVLTAVKNASGSTPKGIDAVSSKQLRLFGKIINRFMS